MSGEIFLEGTDFPAQAFSSDEEFADEATVAARKAFGIKYLFPWQKMVVLNILDSFNSEKTDVCPENDAVCRGKQIVLLPTGAGKSLCFLTPALLLPGVTLVVYPLLALMADQKRRIEESGIPCVVLKGGQSGEERGEIFKRLVEKSVKIIIANPEILQNPGVIAELKKAEISHIAIDEAHCVSEWGDSFRPAYLTLGGTIKTLGVRVVTAFTATASPPVLKRISEILFEGETHLLQSAGDRPNIHYEVRYAYAKKKAVLRACVESKKPLIVFCATRQRTEETARLLCSYFGYEKVKFYHAGLKKEEKEKVEAWFFKSEDGILTATCAYGMGMDKGNIFTVIHLDAPEHLENFIQEAGRAGRKGDEAKSILIWSHGDDIRYRQAKEGSREKAVGGFALTENCRREFMLNYLSGEEVVCSGCDVCDAKRRNSRVDCCAQDAELAVSLIKNHRKMLTRDEAVNLLTKKLNERDLPFFKMNVWDAADSKEILNYLLGCKKIRVLGGFWQNRLDIQKKEKNFRRKNITRFHRAYCLRRNFRWFRRQVLRLVGRLF